ncbi:hypothetical protein, partial [Ralstonia pseudosolanacearum]|uniref:hypothetical protein n=1 Tax=Ralstonia pseudosolanacearum TaxID=1310165 RepID=UPI001FF9C5FE
AETLTAQLAVYNHFASSNEKCRSGLTERHYASWRPFFSEDAGKKRLGWRLSGRRGLGCLRTRMDNGWLLPNVS